MITNLKIITQNKKKFKILSKSDFDKDGLDPLGIHWGQYLALTFSSLLIFSISLYECIPSFKSLILNIIWFINCSGLNCNGAQYLIKKNNQLKINYLIIHIKILVDRQIFKSYQLLICSHRKYQNERLILRNCRKIIFHQLDM